MNILLYRLAQLTPEDDVVPFRTLGNLSSVLQRVAALGSGQTHLSHTDTLVHISHIGVFAHISEEDCFVDSCGYATMSSYSNVPMIGIQHNMGEMFCEFMDDRFYLPDHNTKSEGWPDEVNMGDGADEQWIQLLNDQDLFKQEEVVVEGADEDKSYYYYVPDESGDERICISDKIDFEIFKGEYSYEPQFELLGLNPLRDCVVYGALIDWGHVGHGPLCFATLDGKVQKALYYDCQEACYGWLANGKLAFSDEDGIKTVTPDGTIRKICSGNRFVTVYC